MHTTGGVCTNDPHFIIEVQLFGQMIFIKMLINFYFIHRLVPHIVQGDI